MDEAPSAALRRKPGASIRIAADVVARGEAAALFSAGHTGATVMAAHAAFGMLPGVDRPALAATIPTPRRPAVLLDVGASVECRPPHLLQFAVMGSVYARVALGIDAPRVGLLSIGEEASKGNGLTRESHRLLKASLPSFIGNVEARDVYRGLADVIVRRVHRQHRVEDQRGLVSDQAVEKELSVISDYRSGGAARRQRHRRGWCGRSGPGRCGTPWSWHSGSRRSAIQRIRARLRRARCRSLRSVSGQGAQKVGMGRALADAYPICRETFAEADAALGEPLSRLIFDGPEEQLTLTENTQPAILAVSTAAARLLLSRGFAPAFVAGHSLGEYSANVAAGTFAFGDALRLVRRRGQYMQEAVPAGEGAMAAILGLDADLVAQACAEAANGEVVSAANLNGGGQDRDRRHACDAVARAGRTRQGARRGMRVIPLAVSAVPSAR
jgi:hypothetical protein